MFWSNLSDFGKEARAADDARLREMHAWDLLHETESDKSGHGRNPKARKLFRQMKDVAGNELARRGIWL